MLAFWGYLGWSIVAAAAGAYVWLFCRVVLFPKTLSTIQENKPRLAA